MDAGLGQSTIVALTTEGVGTMRRGAILTAGAVLLASLAGSALLLSPRGGEAATAETRTYYIAADEVAWDYAPSGINQISGEPFGEDENVFVASGRDRIGKVYLKALYREYTSASFTTPKPVAAQWQHLGTLGPVVRAGSVRAAAYGGRRSVRRSRRGPARAGRLFDR